MNMVAEGLKSSPAELTTTRRKSLSYIKEKLLLGFGLFIRDCFLEMKI